MSLPAWLMIFLLSRRGVRSRGQDDINMMLNGYHCGYILTK
ncbi:hypothetical protein LA635_0818 [Erwinia amylovora LA635]|nr:hypothetical protein LA635_0818 [Erwinia amylovora LA635]CDK17809.1 hypothetical protein LA636_0817 [Erwinia amylovora LA636]CDK21178.1 hypothetical protein LA637_0818 [Erwinia amylovora LA637]